MEPRPGKRVRRSLICGVDDSDDGRAAARLAARLAERLRLRPIFVYVSDPHVLVGNHAEAGPAGEPGDDPRARQVLAAVTTEEQVGPVEHRVESGVPAERLAAVAKEEDAVLIVVGSRGRGALRAALLGSVTTELIASAPCSVLVVPPGTAARA